jgi:NAD(P)-dependent dehydrogenase (short-subunit alcohol dehydrogenase family)
MPTKKKILIIGATSAIAEATARLWAAERAQVYLIARNADKLSLVEHDLETRGAQVIQDLLDVNDFERHAPAIEAAFSALERIDVVLLAHGDLPDQRRCESSAEAALKALQTNATSVVSLVTLIANRLQAQGFVLRWLPVGLFVHYFFCERDRASGCFILGTYALIGFLTYGHTPAFDGRGGLTVLAYPRLFLLLTMFIASVYFIWNRAGPARETPTLGLSPS